jgi:tetratricopeptide (TPR) repeat protein
VYAQDSEVTKSTLFLSTSPIRAYVSIDGTPLSEETPLIFKDLIPGEHHIVIRKHGLKRHDLNIDIKPGEIRAIHIELEKADAPNYSKEGQIYIDPVFPKQKTLNAMRIAVPIFIAVSGFLTLNDIVYPKETGLFFSPITITSYAATAGVIGIKVALKRNKKRFEESFHPKPNVIQNSTNDAEECFKKGQEMLTQDRFPEAIDYYIVVIEEYKDSIYFPYALYKIAKIHFITGEYTLAATEFNLIAHEYPLPDLYDRSLKSLSDLYLEQGLYKQSIECLENMVLIDPLYTKEEIDQYIHEIRAQWDQINNHTAQYSEDSALPIHGEYYE